MSAESGNTGPITLTPFRSERRPPTSTRLVARSRSTENNVEPLLVVCMRAMTKIQSKDIRSSLVQAADDFRSGTCRTESGDYFCITLTTHCCIRGYEAGLSCLSRTKIARKSFTFVRVGPVIT